MSSFAFDGTWRRFLANIDASIVVATMFKLGVKSVFFSIDFFGDVFVYYASSFYQNTLCLLFSNNQYDSIDALKNGKYCNIYLLYK